MVRFCRWITENGGKPRFFSDQASKRVERQNGHERGVGCGGALKALYGLLRANFGTLVRAPSVRGRSVESNTLAGRKK